MAKAVVVAASLIGGALAECPNFNDFAPGVPIANSDSIVCTDPDNGDANVPLDGTAPVGTECEVTCATGNFPQAANLIYKCFEAEVDRLCASTWRAVASDTSIEFAAGITCSEPACPLFSTFADANVPNQDGFGCTNDGTTPVGDNTTAPGTVCTVDSCVAGFLPGSGATYTCTAPTAGETSIATWDLAGGVSCEAVTCPDPAVATGGIGFADGTVSITCFLGNEPVANPAVAQAFGTICTAECQDQGSVPQGLPVGDNGEWQCAAPATGGTAADGQWMKVQSGGLTQCANVECEAFADFADRTGAIETPAPACSNTAGGDTCVTSCAADYEPFVIGATPEARYMCSSTSTDISVNGTWMPVENERCVPEVTCAEFDPATAGAVDATIAERHASVPMNGRRWNAVATLDCDSDKSVVGTSPWTCAADGTFIGDQTCQTDCADPNAADGGFTDGLDNIEAVVCTSTAGSVCTVPCVANSSPIGGESQFTCQNGTWINTAGGNGDCALDCVAPNNVDDGGFLPITGSNDVTGFQCSDGNGGSDAAPLGTVCDIVCDDGFGYGNIAVTSVTCEQPANLDDRSVWSTAPTCPQVICPRFDGEPIENADFGDCNDVTVDINGCTFDQSNNNNRPYSTVCEVEGCAVDFALESEENIYYRCGRGANDSATGEWMPVMSSATCNPACSVDAVMANGYVMNCCEGRVSGCPVNYGGCVDDEQCTGNLICGVAGMSCPQEINDVNASAQCCVETNVDNPDGSDNGASTVETRVAILATAAVALASFVFA